MSDADQLEFLRRQAARLRELAALGETEVSADLRRMAEIVEARIDALERERRVS